MCFHNKYGEVGRFLLSYSMTTSIHLCVAFLKHTPHSCQTLQMGIGKIIGQLPSFACVLELPQSRCHDSFSLVPPLLQHRERAALPSPHLECRRLTSHVLKGFEGAESQDIAWLSFSFLFHSPPAVLRRCWAYSVRVTLPSSHPSFTM